MIRIVDRYIFREVGHTFLSVTGILLFILIGNQFARVLGRAAADLISKNDIFLLLGLTSVRFLIVLIPLSLFLSILLALGRLYRDSEMTAIMACGVSQWQLYRPLLLLALMLAGVVAWLSLDVGPWAMQRIEILELSAKRNAEFVDLEPGRFLSAEGGESVFYAESINDDGSFKNIFLQRRVDDRIEIAVARRAEQRRESTDRQNMVLFDGKRYEGVPGSAEFRIIRFAEHGIPVTLPPPELPDARQDTKPTWQLLKSNDLQDRIELQWRMSLPVGAVLLALLASPLARSNPRQGRYGRLAIGVLIYLVYTNLLGAARVWTVQGRVPVEVGIWWVHIALFGLIVFLLRKQSRVGTGKHAPVPQDLAADPKPGASA